MTTLRDYVLDCRCPNCGTLMERKPPVKPDWSLYVSDVLAVVLIVLATILGPVGGHWAMGAYFLANGVFLKTGWRTS